MFVLILYQYLQRESNVPFIMRLKEIKFTENPGEDVWKTVHTNAAHATLLFAAPGLSINFKKYYYANSNEQCQGELSW